MFNALILISSSYIYIVQPEITDEVTDLLENESNPVTFSCQATGEPIPSLSWHYNGAMVNVSNSSKYNISYSLNGTMITSSLTIINTKSSDVGTYNCHAENILGTDKSAGVLTINGKFIDLLYISIFI